MSEHDFDDYGHETHYVGDSMTAEALRDLYAYIEDGFAQINARIDHIARHDPSTNPVTGCVYCEVRRAA
jgi:hypothetical protein